MTNMPYNMQKMLEEIRETEAKYRKVSYDLFRYLNILKALILETEETL